jgi:hypothetical protein
MTAPPTKDHATTRPQDVLDTAIGTAKAGGRLDIVDRLSEARSLLGGPSVAVQVAGGAQQGRASMAAALLRAGSGPPRVTIAEAGDTGLAEAVDVVVFIATAERVLSSAEVGQLSALRHRSPTVVFALTETDRHPGWTDVLQADLELLRSADVSDTHFAVSVDQHSRALSEDDPSLAGTSGIPALAEWLLDLAEQAELSAARAVAEHVLDAIVEMEATSPPRPRRPAPAETAPGSAGRGRWSQVLADGFAAVSSDVDFDLRSRVRTVVAEAERAVDESDPARDWDAIHTWLRERLEYEGRQTRALLASRTAEIAAAVGAEVGGPALQPVDPPAVPDLFGKLPPREPPAGRSRPLAARGRSLVTSGYGGLMMALVLPRFAGIHLPIGFVVGAALLAALLMGGAAMSGERKRQLDARRSRAKSLVRHCADGFLLGASKYTRDAVRTAQQQLRDESAARTAELRRATSPEPDRPRVNTELATLRRHALTLLKRSA